MSENCAKFVIWVCTYQNGCRLWHFSQNNDAATVVRSNLLSSFINLHHGRCCNKRNIAVSIITTPTECNVFFLAQIWGVVKNHDQHDHKFWQVFPVSLLTYSNSVEQVSYIHGRFSFKSTLWELLKTISITSKNVCPNLSKQCKN